jgi:hypothetical protein
MTAKLNEEMKKRMKFEMVVLRVTWSLGVHGWRKGQQPDR